MKKKYMDKILKDMRAVLTRLTLSVQNDYKKDKAFCIDTRFESIPDLFVRIGIWVDDKNRIVSLSMAPPDTFQKEKIPEVMELINWINQRCFIDHLWLNKENNRVVLTKGIMLEGKSIDTEEFENAVRFLLGNGGTFLKAVKDLVSSDEKPEEIIKKMISQHAMPSNRCER
jgi:hypothetical protein